MDHLGKLDLCPECRKKVNQAMKETRRSKTSSPAYQAYRPSPEPVLENPPSLMELLREVRERKEGGA